MSVFLMHLSLYLSHFPISLLFQLREKLQLDRIIDERQYFIVGCSATKDPKSLRDGLELLAEAMLVQHNLNNA